MAVGLSPNYVLAMVKTFADAFNEHLAATGVQVTDIARKSGVSKDALYALRRGTTKNMSVDLAIKVANAFGETVEEFMGLSPVQVRDSLAEQLSRLSQREQQILEASIAAILAQRDLAEDSPSEEPEANVPDHSTDQ